jgi:hypothetical protein
MADMHTNASRCFRIHTCLDYRYTGTYVYISILLSKDMMLGSMLPHDTRSAHMMHPRISYVRTSQS